MCVGGRREGGRGRREEGGREEEGGKQRREGGKGEEREGGSRGREGKDRKRRIRSVNSVIYRQTDRQRDRAKRFGLHCYYHFFTFFLLPEPLRSVYPTHLVRIADAKCAVVRDSPSSSDREIDRQADRQTDR